MPNRRGFLGCLAFAAAALSPSPALATRRLRRRRRAGVNFAAPQELKVAAPITKRREGRFAYEYSDKNVEFTAPDLVRWQKLKLGMSREKVRELVGLAIEEGGGRKRAEEEYLKLNLDAGISRVEADALWKERSASTIFIESWDYGRLAFASPLMVHDFTFSVHFDDLGVVGINDPFGGRFSVDGRPTAPLLLFPYDNAKFVHRPMSVDMRWMPSCGEYPIEYELEVTFAIDTYDAVKEQLRVDWDDASKHRYPATIPYAATMAPGENPCRWRVKAKNRLGESPWSEYRHFQFDGRA
jgi:hypothetical protein